MSIFGCRGTNEVNKTVDGYAKTDYVDVQDGLRVLKAGDTMSGDLNMGGQLVRGLPTNYPPLYRGDEAVSWTQVVGLAQDAVGNLQDPINPQNAATKNYVDSRKPVITVWAEENDPTKAEQYQWSFGNGATGDKERGYPMPAAGRILRMGLSGSARGSPPAEMIVNIVVNGAENTAYAVTKPDGQFSGTITFGTPLELAQGDIINFRSITANPSVTSTCVSLLIELDLE